MLSDTLRRLPAARSWANANAPEATIYYHACVQTRYALNVAVLLLAVPAFARQADLPTVTVQADDTRITESCLIVIPSCTVMG